jgi:SMC interacting uncharacterized protein involved in chromosome segregation
MWNAFLAWLGKAFAYVVPQKADFESLADMAGKQIKAADARYDAHAARLEAHEREGDARHKAMRADLEALHQELRECRDKHAEAENRVREMEERASAKGREIRTLNSQVVGLKAQNKLQQTEIDALKKAAEGRDGRG